MALLAWVKSRKMFLKIQEGTGDNLLAEDRAEGYVDYVLWSTFRAGELGIDELLEPELAEVGLLFLCSTSTFNFNFFSSSPKCL